MSKTAHYFLSMMAALMLALPLTTVAQKPPPLSDVWLLVPRADQHDDFEKGLKAHMAFRQEHGDPRKWQVYMPTLGDRLNRVGIRYCCVSWADVDSYDAWSMENKAIEENYQQNVAPHVESAAHYFDTISWENSHWSDVNGPFTLFAVTEFEIKPGQGSRFDAARDKMSQIAINQGWSSDEHVWMWSSRIGGSPRESVVTPYRDWADIEREGETFFQFLSRKLGSDDEARALLDEFSSAIEGSDYQIWVHRPDLSMQD